MSALSFDLARREKNLAKEQARRRGAARRRTRKETADVARARQASAAIDKELEARRAEAVAKAAREAREAERAARDGGGVLFTAVLRVTATEAEDDKAVLPQSVLEALEASGALGAGTALAFRLARLGGDGEETGRVTHCGVREFTAEEGTVGLPVKVRRSLLGRAQPALERRDSEESLEGPVEPMDLEATPAAMMEATHATDVEETEEPEEEDPGDGAALLGETIRLRFVRLPKATAVRLTPVGHYALQAIPDVKAALEFNFHFHATVTIGDRMQVWHRGQAYDIRVSDVQPHFAASLLDTDVNVDIDEFVPEGPATGPGAGSALPTHVDAAPETEAPATVAFQGQGHSLRAAAPLPVSTAVLRPAATSGLGAGSMASLPEEPPVDDPAAVQVRLRVSQPARQLSRRFRLSDKLGAVFAYLAVEVDGEPGVLVRQYPKTRFTEEQRDATLADLSFAKREAFLVERS